jgi:mono/diheme cytochrome c family protein
MIRRVSMVPMAAYLLAWTTFAVSAQDRGGNPAAAAVKNPIPSSPKSIADGQKLYQTNCRHCHGAKGLGDGPLAPTNPSPSNLTDAEWNHGSSDGEIFAVISNGAGPDSQMKAMKTKLSEKDIWNIVNYIRSLGPKS